ncbi:hypothetical protein BBI10_02020 [Pseudomonas graminis]|uniref:EF-hand domain-containing protein n=1 Tax=Pseudomonas graminis TaxID=158627 RepID=A0A1C2EEW5_9PSED|nr:hypothetical protein BBI10_02020 [Pseudomonas graminis]
MLHPLLQQAAPNPNIETDAEFEAGIAPTPDRPYIVTLSDGTKSDVIGYGILKSSMPLSEAWGPQLLVQGDKDKDNKLSISEFANQLKRVGVSLNTAKKLFESFDVSNSGTLSVDEFVAGIKSYNATGGNIFHDFARSYTQDDQSATAFLREGLSAGNAYWGRQS